MASSKATNVKNKAKMKTFLPKWLADHRFKDWIAPDKDPQKCRCKPCNVVLVCGKSELLKHGQSKKHLLAAQQLRNITTIDNFTVNTVPCSRAYQQVLDVQSAEIKLSAFFAEHNVALQIVEHLVPVIQSCFHDSPIAKDLQLGRQKCTKIIQNVLAKEETHELIKILQTNVFSILVDESTDISDKKYMCLLVRYVCPDTGTVITRLLELIELDAKDCSAIKLCEAVKNSLTSKDIPLQKMVGIASDGASVMVGKFNSFFEHMKKLVPHIILLKCICHTSAIVASKSAQKIPHVEALVAKIATYTHGSARRCAILQEVQDLLSAERKKMLKLSNTRWLCYYQCVERILENKDVLETFFALCSGEDGDQNAAKILGEIKNPETTAYLLFLKYTLDIFNKFNGLFQGRKILIHRLVTASESLFKQICYNYIQLSEMNDIHSSNLSNPRIFKPLEEVYLGPECESFLSQNKNIAKEVRLRCLEYYITACSELQKRLPLKNNSLQELNFLDPKMVLGKENTKVSLENLKNKFGHLVNFDLALLEYRNIVLISEEEKKMLSGSLEKNDLDKWWYDIGQLEDYTGNKKFENLYCLVKLVLSLPHSNAEAERIFSIVTDVKTKKRNRLGTCSLNSLCVFRSSLQSKGTDCTKFAVKKEHLESVKNDLYK